MFGEPLQLADVEWIAENDHGWRFGVARLDTRWVGFGAGSAFAAQARQAFRESGLEPEPGCLCFFPQVGAGYEMGVESRERAILLTGAIAQDPEECYGGVARWLVPPELRGDPEAYRCGRCGEIGCDGATCDDYQDEDYP